MKAKRGDRVKVHYILRDANGKIVESTYESAPIEFVLGDERVIAGFEKNICGMSPGEKKSVIIPPEDAYGYRDERKVFEFPRKNAPGDFDPPVGRIIRMHRADGKPVLVTIVDKNEKVFIMDANHPLAGKELHFEIELVEIIERGR
jgi:peptidylprolyl isomerase